MESQLNSFYIATIAVGCLLAFVFTTLKIILLEDIDPYNHLGNIKRFKDLVSTRYSGLKRILLVFTYEKWRNRIDKVITFPWMIVAFSFYIIIVLISMQYGKTIELREWFLGLIPMIVGVIISVFIMYIKIMEKQIKKGG